MKRLRKKAFWYEEDTPERTAFVFANGKIYEGRYHTDAQKQFLDEYVQDHDFDGRSRIEGDEWIEYEDVPVAYGALYYDHKVAFIDPYYDFSAFKTSPEEVAMAIKKVHPDFEVYYDEQTNYPLEEAEKHYQKVL